MPAFKNNSRSLKISNGKFVENRAFLIDAEISEGNSGSPVFQPDPPLLFRSDMRIIGLVIGMDKSMGLAIVEPASRIGETLDIARKRSGIAHTFCPVELVWADPIQKSIIPVSVPGIISSLGSMISPNIRDGLD